MATFMRNISKKILNIMLPDTLSKFLQLYENKKIT